MKQKCKYCGKTLKETADVCLNCGKLVEKEKKEVIKEEPTKNVKKKIPGNGKSIAGMVLGIVSSTWVFFYILFLILGYTLFSLVPSLVGLPLSIVGYNKMKTGKNISGIVLNSIGIGVSLIIYIYIMLFA